MMHERGLYTSHFLSGFDTAAKKVSALIFTAERCQVGLTNYLDIHSTFFLAANSFRVAQASLAAAG